MNVHYGCAPINWTNDDLPSLGGELTYQQCLSEMALAGYTGSEIGCKFPKDYDTLKKALDLRGLVICNMWFSSRLTTFDNEATFQAFRRHLEYTYSLGARVVGIGECGVTIHMKEDCPIFSKRPMLDDKQYANLASGLDTLGKIAADRGMKACLHPHMGTGIQSRDEIDRMMQMTDPATVGLLLDTGHCVVAGEDPVDIFAAYKDRVAHIHIKDVRRKVLDQVKGEDRSFLWGVKEGLFTVPGDGDSIDWPAFFSCVKKSDYSGWIVVEAEQDPGKADPLEYAQKARRFMRGKLGV